MLIKARGTVKWYNELRGYGFVKVHGEPADIFLHGSVMEPGTKIYKDSDVEILYENIKGKCRVTEVFSVDNERVSVLHKEHDWTIGYVKSFDDRNGYGFIEVREIDRDIFLHVTTLHKCGIYDTPFPGDRVKIKFHMQKDRYAVTKFLYCEVHYGQADSAKDSPRTS